MFCTFAFLLQNVFYSDSEGAKYDSLLYNSNLPEKSMAATMGLLQSQKH